MSIYPFFYNFLAGRKWLKNEQKSTSFWQEIVAICHAEFISASPMTFLIYVGS